MPIQKSRRSRLNTVPQVLAGALDHASLLPKAQTLAPGHQR